MVSTNDVQTQNRHRRATTKRGWDYPRNRVVSRTNEDDEPRVLTNATARTALSTSFPLNGISCDQIALSTKERPLQPPHSSRSRHKVKTTESEGNASEPRKIHGSNTYPTEWANSSIVPLVNTGCEKVVEATNHCESPENVQHHREKDSNMVTQKPGWEERRNFTTTGSMPSLSSYSSGLSTDFEGESNSGCSAISIYRSQTGSNFSMPSLTSMSSSDSTSTLDQHNLKPKLITSPTKFQFPTIQEEFGERSWSLTSISVELDDPQPTSELTLNCNNHSPPSMNVVDEKNLIAKPSHISRKTSSSASPKQTLQSFSDNSSEGSVIGQKFLIDYSNVNDSQDVTSIHGSRGSLAYSATSHASETVESGLIGAALKSSNMYDSEGCNAEGVGSSQYKNQDAIQPALITSSPVATKYDGILLELVGSMHGSFKSGLDDSSPTLNTNNSGAKSANRRTRDKNTNKHQSVKAQHTTGSRDILERHSRSPTPLNQPEESISCCLSTESTCSSLANTTSFSKATTSSLGKVVQGKCNKAPRRRSANCSVGSNSSSESMRRRDHHSRRPPHKQPRRHSLGNAVPQSGNSRGESDVKSAFTRRRNDSQQTEQTAPERGSSKSNHKQCKCAKVEDEPTKFFLEQLDGTNTYSSHRHGGLHMSPVTIPKRLTTEDLNQMRNTAPPRLSRIRSPRRRIIHIAHHFEADRSRMAGSVPSISPLSDAPQRVQISKIVDQLSVESGKSATSLPPRTPTKIKMNSPKGKPPIDPRAKTVRHGNRTVDRIPEIADIISSRRRSCANSTSERQYRIIGLPPFVEDNEDDTSESSGSTSVFSQEFSRYALEEPWSHRSTKVSIGRTSLHKEDSESSHLTLQSDSSPLPLTPRHRKPLLRAIPSTSPSQIITGCSDHSNSTIEPLTRIDHTFRHPKADRSKGKTASSNDIQHLQLMLPRPSRSLLLSRNVTGHSAPLELPLHTDDRVSFVSELTCDVKSQEGSSRGSGIFHPSTMNDSISDPQTNEDLVIPMAPFLTSTSITSYDLKPFRFNMSGSPHQKTSTNNIKKNDGRDDPPSIGLVPPDNRTSFVSDLTCEILVHHDSSEDSSFARHAATMDWSPQDSQILVSPPTSPLNVPLLCGL